MSRTPGARGTGGAAAGRIPVLLYHAVMDDPPGWIAEFTLTPRAFAAHLDAIVASGRTPSPSAPSPTIWPDGRRCRPGPCC